MIHRLLSVFLVACLLSTPAAAQEAETVVIKGVKKVCMPPEDAAVLERAVLHELPLTQKALDACEVVVEGQGALLSDLVKKTDFQIEVLEGQSDSMKGMEGSLADLRTEQNMTTFYVTIGTLGGFVVGVGGTLLILYAIKKM